MMRCAIGWDVNKPECGARKEKSCDEEMKGDSARRGDRNEELINTVEKPLPCEITGDFIEM